MSYQVLARKWRPQHFARLVGQDHVKNALGNALTNNRLHHAYLFTGTRGVGKTTIARIFAKSLNCEQGITATPCGQCSACTEIDNGNFVDLLEIDAASRTKVEDTRDLLDNVQYAPSRGRFKIYLIDEVHMLSRHSFNALLKTLEEPPAHVKFLLATTDPQKLPVTVLSRCLQFNLLALSPAQIEQHLAFVLQQENIHFSPAALTLLARAAKGSLRDSLSLTDQAIAQSNANITEDVVRAMLGLLDQSWAEQLLSAVLNQDMTALQQTLSALVQQHSHFEQVLDDILSLLHLTALSQFSLAAASLSEQSDTVRQLAEQLTPAQVQLYYQLLISGKKELPFAPDPLTGLQMALLRAMAFSPQAETAIAAPAASKPVISLTPKATPSAVSEVATTEKPQVTQALLPPTDSEAVSQPENSGQSVIAQDNSEQASAVTAHQAETAASQHSNIDPVTASIMARRGVNINPVASEKKSERPSTPQQAKIIQPQVQHPQIKQLQPVAEPAVVIPPPAVQQKSTAPVLTEPAQPAQDPAMPQFSEQPDFADSDDMQPYDMAATEALWQQHEAPEAAQPDALVAFDGSINADNFSVRFAAQVDAWAARVETLDTGGLSRLFLLNAEMQLEQDKLTLTVAQSQQHLDSADFRAKLQQVLQHSFNQPLQINIRYQPEVTQSPLAIQQRIVQERLVYVRQLLQQDEKVQQLQQLFDAELLVDSITVN